MKVNERLYALEVLMQLFTTKTPLSYLLKTRTKTKSNSPYLTKPRAVDAGRAVTTKEPISAFTKALCFGVCRYYVSLELLAKSLVKKPPKDLDLWLAIIMGLYQIEYLHTPDYAVVKETVGLLDALHKAWAKGFVNAILRTYCRERAERIAALQHNSSFVYAHPAWLLARIQADYNSQWQDILLANNTQPPMSLRVNSRLETRAAYLERLQQQGIAAMPLPYATHGIILNQPCDVMDLPGFAAGSVSVQDAAAQLAVELLALQPGLRVLDACAAPGGKTGHILETETKLKECIALDIDNKRLQLIFDNLQRLHLQATLIQGDATDPAAWWDGVAFDRILLDAPCSAIGVIRRHPDIKLLRTAADITDIVSVQQKLLNALWPLLASGGLMLYATCSIIPVENAQQIAAFLATHTDAHCMSEPQPWGQDTGYGWQILPGEGHCDGFFYSVLQKL